MTDLPPFLWPFVLPYTPVQPVSVDGIAARAAIRQAIDWAAERLGLSADSRADSR